jgi:putative DNA primase/helicase
MKTLGTTSNNSNEEHTLLEPIPENIPGLLRVHRQWVCWREEERRDKRGERKLTKVPYAPETGTKASTTNHLTWSSFERALEAFQANGSRYTGIGFVFSKDDPYTGVDLDKCRNPETGEVAPWAQEWIEAFGSYTEVSPTGTGIHIFITGETPHNGKTAIDGRTVEIYSIERYFTITGVRP